MQLDSTFYRKLAGAARGAGAILAVPYSARGGNAKTQGSVLRAASAPEAKTFVWRERHGPAVTTPTRKGFGHVILSDVAQRFASKVAMDFPASGFCYELQVEIEKLEARE